MSGPQPDHPPFVHRTHLLVKERPAPREMVIELAEDATRRNRYTVTEQRGRPGDLLVKAQMKHVQSGEHVYRVPWDLAVAHHDQLLLDKLRYGYFPDTTPGSLTSPGGLRLFSTGPTFREYVLALMAIAPGQAIDVMTAATDAQMAAIRPEDMTALCMSDVGAERARALMLVGRLTTIASAETPLRIAATATPSRGGQR